MNELLPIALGMVTGLLLTSWRTSHARRLSALATLSVMYGAAATVVSGEFLISWGFLLIDIPLAFGAGVVAILIRSMIQHAFGAARGR